MKVNYKIFNDEKNVSLLYENAKGNVNQLNCPFKKFENDFCYDVVATSCEEIHPNVYEYGIGLGFQLDKQSLINEFRYIYNLPSDCSNLIMNWMEENLIFDIDLRPRSSIRDTGLILCNCEGTIDEGYINEVKASFYHVIPTLPIYKIGDKIGQIKIGITLKCDFNKVNEFNDTERGLGGHGSTNK